MRVLITGGSGQVGTALRESAPCEVLIQAPSSGELDIRSRASVDAAFSAWQPDLAVNAAAFTQVDRAEEEIELAMEVNGAGAGNLAAVCATFDCPLIHLSTDYIFDGKKEGPYLEQDSPAPRNVYGHSKLQGERAVRESLDEHLILRVSWVFSTTGSNFVKTMLSLAGRDEVRVVNDQHGTPCAASSIAAAIWQIAVCWTGTSRTGVYHFASSPATTWFEFAQAVYSSLREADPATKTPEVVPITTGERISLAERPRNSVLDCSRLQSDFGIPTPDWLAELRSVVGQLSSG